MDQKYLDALLAGTATPDMAAPSAPAPQGEPEAQQPDFSAIMVDAVKNMQQNPSDMSLPQAIGLGTNLSMGLGTEDSSAANPQAMTGEEQMQGSNVTGPAVAGGLKSVFETKDFLFGDTPKDRQSAFRQEVEQYDAQMKEESIVAGLSSGIGQFAVAMVGLGKIGAAAKMLPAVKGAVGGVESLKGGKLALESGKAALAGAVAFDPYEARLSNLIQGTVLANPVNEWLAAKPGDTAAWGRVKNAMESLGMDAAIIGSLKLGGTVWRYMQQGNTKAARRAISDFEAQREADAEVNPQIADEVNPNELEPGQPAGQPADQLGGTEQAGPDSLPPSGEPAGPEAMAAGRTDAGDEGAISGEVPPRSAEGGSTVEAPEGQLLNGPDAPTGSGVGTPEGNFTVNGESVPPEFVSVEATANPTQAMMDADLVKPPKFKTTVDVTGSDFAGAPAATGVGPRTRGIVDDMDLIIEEAEKDWDKLTSGDHEDALAAAGRGVRFSPDMKPFYDRMRTDSDVINAVDLAVNLKAEQLAKQGFRGTLTDAKLARQVQAFAALANIDPAGIMGILAQGAKASQTMTAKMIVVGSLTSKAFTDATLLATRYRLGDYSEFGSKQAMEDAIAKRFSLATTMLRMTDEYRAQAGRSLRALRGKPFRPELFEGLAKDRFYELLEKSGGNPSKLRILADPTLYEKIMDTANYLRINSLVSGWTTQAINLMTSGYMTGVRPMERMLGATARIPVDGFSAASAAYRENLKQYTYMGNALLDGWKNAFTAFTRNDSVIRPHGQEAMNAGQSGAWQVPGSQAFGPGFFKPWDSTPNLIYNALSIPLSVVGTPTRILGSADELMKQITYRSKVMAKANMEANEKAIQQGLTGKGYKNFVKSYVQDTLDNAFDAEGRGIDPNALNEANIATFQQDLLPGTLGRGVQTLIANEKTHMLRFILPFVKTPTNVIRYGWKMTPVLNMAQKEYRAMLSGKMGREAQQQAVGQMSMGALFMGAAAYTMQGRITGGGPSDPRVKSELLATGWRPYSIVDENEDGTKTYTPFNRFDPVALPLGIMADIMDATEILGDEAADSSEIEAAIGALGISLAKQFTSRTYLMSLNQTLDALSDPEKRGEAFIGQMASSFVPFSSLTRQASSDPYMRDARSIADKMMQAVPGMSENLRPRYNWLGQPVVNRTGLWTDDNGSLVDQEVQRLALLPDAKMISAPSPKWGRVDLREITLADGTNAYEKYQQLSGKPNSKATDLRTSVARLMRSEAYQKAADGDAGIKGTKLYLLHEMVYKYRTAASKIIKADPAVREAMLKDVRAVQDHWKNLKQPLSNEQQGTLDNILRGFGAASQQGQ